MQPSLGLNALSTSQSVKGVQRSLSKKGVSEKSSPCNTHVLMNQRSDFTHKTLGKSASPHMLPLRGCVLLDGQKTHRLGHVSVP